jgi:hypothetical protein
VSLKIYAEGGNNEKGGDLSTECRRAFNELLYRATGKRFAIVACGSRKRAYDDFAKAVRQGDPAALLVDSEDVPEPANRDAWEHLTTRDGWTKLDASAFLVAVCTETWLLTDPAALEAYYGKHFKAAKITKWSNLEVVEKRTLNATLNACVKETAKGEYSKSHTFAVLAMVDHETLAKKCARARVLFDWLKEQ